MGYASIFTFHLHYSVDIARRDHCIEIEQSVAEMLLLQLKSVEIDDDVALDVSADNFAVWIRSTDSAVFGFDVYMTVSSPIFTGCEPVAHEIHQTRFTDNLPYTSIILAIASRSHRLYLTVEQVRFDVVSEMFLWTTNHRCSSRSSYSSRRGSRFAEFG